MITIREEQFAAFRRVSIRDFERRMMEHIRKCFPARLDTLGEQKVIDLIKYGIQRAAHYGITTQRDVCKYIDLSVVFGREFDTDPKLPWARSVLEDSSAAGSMERMDYLYEVALKNVSR
jgi:hypothetical protein